LASRPDLTREDLCRALVGSWETTFRVEMTPDRLSVAEAAVVAESSHVRDLAVTQTV
jgi:hypothetical protein